MKIAFVTPGYDPQDVRRGSGTFYYLSRELERQGVQISYFGPIEVPEPFPTRIIRTITQKLLHKRFITHMDPFVAYARGRKISQILSAYNFDLILTNDHGIVSGLQTTLPIVLYTDVMLPHARDINKTRLGLSYQKSPRVLLNYYRITVQRSLIKAALCVFPAQWLKDLTKSYRIDQDKVKMIPFGANIPDPGSSIAESRNFNACLQKNKFDLLFVGKDWQRKGGDIAVRIVSELRDSGIDARLHIVGNQFDSMPPYVISYGLLDKNNPGDWQKMDDLYKNCDVFIFPSSSEGSAIVPREAAAYGLPTLAYKIDGVSSSISDGKSGYLLDPKAVSGDFVKIIQDWFKHPSRYQDLARTSRLFYDDSANWCASVSSLVNEILNFLVTSESGK